MAAAAVAGLIPVVHSVAGDKTSYYIGRQMWFGFTGLYGLVVYVVRLPWALLHQDFWCHGNISTPCLVQCFEAHFDRPVVGVWYFFCFTFLALFILLEFFVAQLRHKQAKLKALEAQRDDCERSSVMGVREEAQSQKRTILDFHREKMMLDLYLLYFLLQLLSQGLFATLLVLGHLPLVDGSPVRCSTPLCPGPFSCLVRGSKEKRMSIYTLFTLAAMILVFCSCFFAYSIHHYFLRGVAYGPGRSPWAD
ncbi:uncharacterized protein LOC114807831 [Ornithorhynchus anatinus]|uniref:uncharacterized protein LOC114807831 n=1 Tax=Ornithorhynchus anatinus TaxID=9258 RepID=UPI000223EEA3|nr:uncharacterized protein LOC114807831 [Ornithorhynchus anatinus]